MPPSIPSLRPRRVAVLLLLVLGLFGAGRARADEFGAAIDLSSWKLTLGGYGHVAYRWIQEPVKYNLAGRNNGFQLEQARIGINLQYKDQFAMRLSFEGASEDRLGQSFVGGSITTRLRDAYGTWAPLRALRLTIGQMTTPWDLDSMRSDAELPFVSRSVAAEGVQPSEGYALRGMGVDRNLGLSIHSGDIAFGKVQISSFRYAIFVGNGNGENQILNDNNLPAVFARVEYSFWGRQGVAEDRISPMRARTDRRHRPILNLGLAGQYNPRTAGNLPNLINETDAGAAADVIVSIVGVDLEGGILYLKTFHDTLSSVPDWERFGWWAHLRYALPKIPVVEIIPGYRISSYAPRAHLETSAPSPAEDKVDSDLTLLYHTFGLQVRPTQKFPLRANLNYTLTQERANNQLKNDRVEVDVVVWF